MENLSILNPPVIDLLSDPRVTSASLLKTIDEQQSAITKQVTDWLALIKPGDVTPFDAMMFAYVQQLLQVTTLNTKLAAVQKDHLYKLNQLSLRLERLTKWLICLTVALGVFTIPLAIDAIKRLWAQ
jgi:hypothetical protein